MRARERVEKQVPVPVQLGDGGEQGPGEVAVPARLEVEGGGEGGARGGVPVPTGALQDLFWVFVCGMCVCVVRGFFW